MREIARYSNGINMDTLCLRCRIYSWQELNGVYKRAWNYRQRALGSARQASSWAPSGRMRPPFSSLVQPRNDQHSNWRPRSIDGLRYSSMPTTGRIQAYQDPMRSRKLVYIGVGSNIGDRLKNIEDAC